MSESFYELPNFRDKETFKFKTFSTEVFKKLNESLESMKQCKTIDDLKNNLLEVRAEVFSDQSKAINRIWEIVDLDRGDNNLESKKEGWDFYYFFGYSHIFPDCLLVLVNLFYPENTSEKGNVIYNVVYIKRKNGKFFLWSST